MSVTASTPSFPFVKGLQRTTKMLPPASTAIQPGDFIYDTNTGGVCGIASAFTWTSNLATTQANFVTQFVGVSLEQRISSDASTTNPILIETEAEGDFACAALGQAYNIGTFFGLAGDVGNNLLDQVVAQVSDAAHAVGKLIEYAPSGATKVRLHIMGKTPLGGVS